MQAEISSFSRLIGEVESKRLDPISVVILTNWSKQQSGITDNSTTVIEQYVSEIKCLNLRPEARLQAYHLLSLKDFGSLNDVLQRIRADMGMLDRPIIPTKQGSGDPPNGRENIKESKEFGGMQSEANSSYLNSLSSVPYVQSVQVNPNPSINPNPSTSIQLLNRPGFNPPNQSGDQIPQMNLVRVGVNQPGQTGAQVTEQIFKMGPKPQPEPGTLPAEQAYNSIKYQAPHPSQPQGFNPGNPSQPQGFNPVQLQAPHPSQPQGFNPGNPSQPQGFNPVQLQAPHPSQPQGFNPRQSQAQFPGQPSAYNPSQSQAYKPNSSPSPNPPSQPFIPSQPEALNPAYSQYINPLQSANPAPLPSINPAQSQAYPSYANPPPNTGSSNYNPPSANIRQSIMNTHMQGVPGIQPSPPPKQQIPDYQGVPGMQPSPLQRQQIPDYQGVPAIQPSPPPRQQIPNYSANLHGAIPINQPQIRDQLAKCGICNLEIKAGLVQLKNCGHKLHLDCLTNTYEMVNSSKCPIGNCDRDLNSLDLNRLKSKAPQNKPQYPPQYPPQNPPQYPPQNKPQYPPQNQPQYPPQNPPQYPPQNKPQYPPQNQPPNPPQGNPSEEQEVMNMLAMDPLFMKCPAEKCFYVIYNENKSLVLDCPRCKQSYCLKCKKISHPGETCNEFRGNNPPQYQQHNPGISYNSQPPKRVGNACLCCGDNVIGPSITLRCGDVFHRECISRHVRGSLSSNTHPKCMCDQPLSQQEIQELLR